MSRAIISALALWLAFSGVAAAEQLYVNESGWWYEGGALNVNGTPIQAVVDAAGEGDAIFVHGGNYYENVDVDKPRLTLEGEGADVATVTAADSGDHVFEVTKDYVNISGFAVRGATDDGMIGIYLDNVDCCNISGNNVYGNYRGIYLDYSSSNALSNNTVNSNNGGSIYLSSSNSNMIANNAVNSSNHYGIYLYYSSNNTLENNDCSNTCYGVYLRSSSNNTLTDNNVYSNNDCGVYLLSSSNNTLQNNIANSNDGCGIQLCCSSNNTLEDNTANSNKRYGSRNYGIRLDSSSNYNTLTSNTANYNNYCGIRVGSSSNYNTLTNNTANSNNHYGIILDSSSNNTLTSNTMNSNDYYGIYLYNADNNNITCNLVKNNTQNGFYPHSGSTGNNISYNNIIENGNYNTSTSGWEWQFYIDQYNPVEAKHNYWGAGMNNTTIDVSIYDDEEGGWGAVEFYPFETEPVPCAPGPERPAFTTTDAVIALQIAVGSRPPDLRWDVSGDKRVTSLDALMILQAAAAGTEIG